MLKSRLSTNSVKRWGRFADAHRLYHTDVAIILPERLNLYVFYKIE